jgi:serine/threonine-protein kinase
VCEGLYYAHQKVDLYGNPLNIVHRDVTPENIFVSFDGTVKVLDFGIAKAANQIEQTRAGEIKGKLSYMSPEQCMGKQLDCRSDLFSLGVVLYEWLTGFKLFTGDSEVAILKSITEGKIYAPSYFKADIPEAVESILMKALAKDREERYQTAWEMQYDLDQFLSQYEFTPSNIHLSNFLKQLFNDELEEEKKRVGRTNTPAGPPEVDQEEEHDPEHSEEPEEIISQIEEAQSHDNVAGPQVAVPIAANGKADQTLAVQLSAKELEQLAGIARKHNISVGHLVRDVMLGWLKYK